MPYSVFGCLSVCVCVCLRQKNKIGSVFPIISVENLKIRKKGGMQNAPVYAAAIRCRSSAHTGHTLPEMLPVQGKVDTSLNSKISSPLRVEGETGNPLICNSPRPRMYCRQLSGRSCFSQRVFPRRVWATYNPPSRNRLLLQELRTP